MNARTNITSMDTSSSWLKISTGFGYLAVLTSIAVAWSLREQNLIRAADGLGYWLGILGGSLMLLLLIYPLRKRIRALNRLGSVRFWFRTHMIFGILGPLLVLFHSNFILGSLNGRLALICTLIVAASGILGRYLYAKIHHGMHGQKVTLESLQQEIQVESNGSGSMFGVPELISNELIPHEQAALNRSNRVLPSVLGIAVAPLVSWRLKRQLTPVIRDEVDRSAARSEVFAEHRDQLFRAAENYLGSRLATYRKFAQLKGAERLFGLWHVVHFPLFLVMVIAAIVHVVAVHAY